MDKEGKGIYIVEGEGVKLSQIKDDIISVGTKPDAGNREIHDQMIEHYIESTGARASLIMERFKEIKEKDKDPKVIAALTDKYGYINNTKSFSLEGDAINSVSFSGGKEFEFSGKCHHVINNHPALKRGVCSECGETVPFTHISHVIWLAKQLKFNADQKKRMDLIKEYHSRIKRTSCSL